MASVFGRILDNWKLKTLAFALAVLLWIVVSADQVTSDWIWIPLQVQVADPDYRIIDSDAPAEVQVRFSGPGRDLLDLALRRPPLRLTVSDITEPIETRTLDPRMVQLPSQIAVNALDVRPNSVRLEFMRLASVEVPVQVRIAAELGPEWSVGDTLHVEPDRISVSGPIEQVRTIDEVVTFPLRLTSDDSIFNRIVPIDTTGLRGLELSSRNVQVSGRVERLVERTISGIPVDVGPGVLISPEAVSVELRGPSRLVQASGPGTFRVVVSIDEIPDRIPPGGVSVPLRIAGLRTGVQATLSPATVRLFPTPSPPEPDPPADSVPEVGLVPSADTSNVQASEEDAASDEEAVQDTSTNLELGTG